MWILNMVLNKILELFKEVTQVFIKMIKLLYRVILMEYQLMVLLKVILMVFL